ncbi:MAG: glycosyl transferase family 2 [Candidatus Marinimicrobia bacterium]|jgi:spore coat polysaccharide biosynthesis protein SpsF (cytidylyltransferase family)|nr:glycosyl transferase family 2 [Candidatus Neomarinimicrobiota bacterium]
MLGIVIQARLGSKRLPNKMLLPFYEGKGVLELLIEDLLINFNNLPIIIATTGSIRDDPIIKLCLKHKVNYYRGSETNVLERFVDVANKFSLKKIIRVCADNPFLNMEYLNILIQNFSKSDADYLSFQTSKNIPVIRTHYGFWAEGVTLEALKKIQRNTNKAIYLEHVTNFIYENSVEFKIEFTNIDSFIEQHNSIRMTLDTYEDYLLLKEIYSKYILLERTTLRSLIDFVYANNTWLEKMNLQILNNIK